MDEIRNVLPKDFNPYLAVDALKGISEAIHWFVTEGPGAEQPLSRGAHASLIGLTWAGRNYARQLHAYFRFLDENGIELPYRDGSDENSVKEIAGNYAVN